MNYSIKFNISPKVLLSQRIRKRNYKSLGTSVINSTMSPPFLHLDRLEDIGTTKYAPTYNVNLICNIKYNNYPEKEGGDIGL